MLMVPSPKCRALLQRMLQHSSCSMPRHELAHWSIRWQTPLFSRCATILDILTIAHACTVLLSALM